MDCTEESASSSARELARLHARVEQLERRARVWNGVAIVALATLAGCAALSASIAGPKVLRGNALELVDAEGNAFLVAGEFVSAQPKPGDAKAVGLMLEAPDGSASVSIRAMSRTTADGVRQSGAHVDIEADGPDETTWSIARLSAAGDQGRLFLDSYEQHSLELEVSKATASAVLGRYDFDLPESDGEDAAKELRPLIQLRADSDAPTIELRDKTASKVVSTQ